MLVESSNRVSSIPFAKKRFFKPCKYFRPTAMAKKLNKFVVNEFCIINRPQVADKPIFAVTKTIAEKTISVDQIAAEVLNEAPPRADADVIAFT